MTTINWNKVKKLSAQELSLMGFVYWNKQADPEGKTLMLIPERFFSSLPAGYKVESIMGEKVVYDPKAKPNDKGYVDNDTRGGMLAYGIRAKL